MTGRRPRPSFEEAVCDLAAIIEALQPFNEVLVLCGGFAAWLYRSHPDFGDPHGEFLVSLDIDWAVPPRLPENLGSLSAALREGGFSPLRFRGSTPPVIKYQHDRWGTERPEPICVEFLTPLIGKDMGGAALQVQPGVTAILLRFMDLALDRPITMEVQAVPELEMREGTRVQLPHPGNYLLHKALTAPRRRNAAKMMKDLAYIFDVVVLSRPEWPSIRERIESFEGQGERGIWLNKARADLKRWFETPQSYGCVGVADVFTAADPRSPMNTERVCRVMKHALPRLALWPAR